MKKVFIILIIIVLSNIFAIEYSNEPLSKNIIMNRAEWVVELVGFNNYLADNIETIPKENIKGLRENTYLLIDSILKDKYSENRNDYLDHEISNLTLLFNWGSELGLFGCDLNAAYFNQNNDEIIKSAEPDTSFQLSFNYPKYTIKSINNNWNVSFPFYFMISKMKQFKANYGTNVQYVQLSALFSNHLQDDYYSQSTISIIISPTENKEMVKDFWLNAFKIGKKSINKDFELNYKNYYDFDKVSSMHKEITFIEKNDCMFVITYAGLDGPYQSNRIHYLDFLKSFNIE